MKVFITWSGEASRAFAQALRGWLPAVIQGVKPYFSPEDVAKGSRWSSEIARQLQEARVGILCLTRQNLDAPWLLFEAGALSKSLDRSRVCPALFGVDPAELTGPLAQFQAARFSREEMRLLIATINDELGDAKVPEGLLGAAFDKWWPDLDERVSELLSLPQAAMDREPDLTDDFAKLIRSLTVAWNRARDAGAKDVLPALTSLDQAIGDLITKLGEHIRATELERLARQRDADV